MMRWLAGTAGVNRTGKSGDLSWRRQAHPLRRMPLCDSAEPVDSVWWSQATHLAGSRDPLDRAAADSELLGDLVQTWAPRCSQRVTDAPFQLGVDEGATTVLAVGLSPS